ncbi:hypothetical protein [Bacillus sp. CDB3]|uniref:hypothetical protein n=1 Tax=Bacillus sp. CDB3 TaxID=360310 RepID=UPI0009D8B856|nr:hypothetical protein [Bacillus sp. CDB3]OQR53200.1 hypothetical protein CDB3_31285 [Bacillus sp. CDB3]
MTEYHFDDEVYTDYTEFKKVLAKDWYNQYNKYMIQTFFTEGKEFKYEGHLTEVIENNCSDPKGWLYLKSYYGGDRTVSFRVHPRKVLKAEPLLREKLEQMLKDIDLNEIELYEQIELF